MITSKHTDDSIRQSIVTEMPRREKRLVTWHNMAKGATRDESGYWRSAEGRFTISPNYRHTIYPDSYELRDNNPKSKWSYASLSYNTIRECKDQADSVVRNELDAER